MQIRTTLPITNPCRLARCTGTALRVHTRRTTRGGEVNARLTHRIWTLITGIVLTIGISACGGGVSATEAPQATQTARVIYLPPPTNTPEPAPSPTPTARPYCDGMDVARWLAVAEPPVDGLSQVASTFSNAAQAEAVQDVTPYLAQAKQWEYTITNSDPPPCAQVADSYLVTAFGDWRVFWEDVGTGDISDADTNLIGAGNAVELATPEIKTLSSLIGTSP